MSTRQASPRSLLKNCTLFRDLPTDSLTRIAWLANSRTYHRDAVICTQGEPGDALFVVVSGRVRISATSEKGKEVFFNLMGPNDAFGEIAVIDGEPRTASAVAMEETNLLVISRPHFIQLLEKDPTVSIHLLKLFCARIRWSSEMIEEAAFFDVPARMARRLIDLIPETREGQDPTIELSQEELARFLGVTRQVINQYLQTWRRSGWIELGRGRLTFTNLKALSDFAKQTE